MRISLKPERAKIKGETKIPINVENSLKSKLIKNFKELGVLVSGDFLLKSGKRSDFYINIKAAIGSPVCVELMLELIDLKFKNSSPLSKVTNVVGTGLGGHVFTSFLSSNKKLVAGYDRGSSKSHGTGKIWEGIVPKPQDNTIITDDVYSSGTSVNQTLESLEKEVGSYDMIQAIFVVANRSNPKKTFHVASNGKEIPIISLMDDSNLF